MHEQYMNFFKPQKKPPTDTLHRERVKNGAETGIENKREASKKTFN